MHLVMLELKFVLKSDDDDNEDPFTGSDRDDAEDKEADIDDEQEKLLAR